MHSSALPCQGMDCSVGVFSYFIVKQGYVIERVSKMKEEQRGRFISMEIKCRFCDQRFFKTGRFSRQGASPRFATRDFGFTSQISCYHSFWHCLIYRDGSISYQEDNCLLYCKLAVHSSGQGQQEVGHDDWSSKARLVDYHPWYLGSKHK